MTNQNMKKTVKTFIDDNLRPFSAHSNIRGIPFIGDGFKQSQRKAIWGLIARGENSPKDTVERISSRAASDTNYHHGVGSLAMTMVGLAQDFPGTNNINLLVPHGQFGSHLSREPGAARYIKTELSPNFRMLFKKEDDLILEHHYDNGVKLEPHFFIPILPTVLINGTEGMGTGHSTQILQYNPDQIRTAIQLILSGMDIPKNTLIPWFKGYTGTVTRDPETAQVITKGILKVINSTKIKITELPIGVTAEKYTEHLKKLEDKKVIVDFDDMSDKNGFDFEIKCPRALTDKSEDELYTIFKLVGRTTENLTVWNPDGVLQRYEHTEALLKDWTQWRVVQYERRRIALIAELQRKIEWGDERIRFIQFYLNNVDVFKNTGKKDLINLLQANDFKEIDKLLGMPIWSLTKDRIEELNEEVKSMHKELQSIQNDTAEKIFNRELSQLKI